MNFGEAIEALKQGKRVTRSGWNGKGMWLALTPGSKIDGGNARAGALLALARERAPFLVEAGEITISPHIDMRAADGSLVIGWLASQTDMLAEDWNIY